MQLDPSILRQCWFLAGPTACGKTAVGIVLARRLGAEILSLDGALDRLEQISKRASEVGLLRYFAGLTLEQTAKALDVSAAIRARIVSIVEGAGLDPWNAYERGWQLVREPTGGTLLCRSA